MAVLTANKRSEIGTRQARRLRAAGRLPGVVYGHGQPCVSLVVELHEIELAVHHGERLLEIELDGQKENVLIKDIQYDTFAQQILHVDFTRVSLDERVEVTVPIVLRGTAAGIDEGGFLQQMAQEVTLECVVTAIPDEIRLPVADMMIGHSRLMRDLPIPEEARLINDPEDIVCSLSVLAEEVEEADVEKEAAQPEVIGERDEEETDDDGAKSEKT